MPDQITSRWLVAWSVIEVPVAKLAEEVVPVATFRPAGVEVTRSPPRPLAVSVSVAAAGAPHTLATPPPPQVWGAVQTPQVSVPPQPSGMVPQFLPWAAQVVGVQAAEALAVQVWGAREWPRVRPPLQLSGRAPEFLAGAARV